MITKQVIKSLYKKYSRPPRNISDLDVASLFEYTAEYHDLIVDIVEDELGGMEETLVIRNLESDSPFRKLALKRINAIVPFDEWVAIVLHSSIVFLSRNSSAVSAHVKTEPMSFFERIKTLFGR